MPRRGRPGPGPDALYAPVRAEEASGRNKIPVALAKFYAHMTGARDALDIAQGNRAFHTGARPMERIVGRLKEALDLTHRQGRLQGRKSLGEHSPRTGVVHTKDMHEIDVLALDEGPIIEQAVERVHQNMSVADYVSVGRDIEAQVLARAVKWHAEHRLLLNGGRTVVFR